MSSKQDALAEEARRAAIVAEVEARKRAIRESHGSGLTLHQIIDRLNAIPTFAVLRVTDAGNEFVSLTFAAADGEKGVRCCPFFADVAECKDALQQTQQQSPDQRLALGTMPLGKAFALAMGWATAPAKAPFTVRAAPETAHKLRPLLVSQLEEAGLPTYWYFPAFVCAALRTPACLPVFLTREALAAAWTASGKEGMPTGELIVTDLRILVRQFMQGGDESDWSAVTFVGSNDGWKALEEGAAQADEALRTAAGSPAIERVEEGVLGVVGGL